MPLCILSQLIQYFAKCVGQTLHSIPLLVCCPNSIFADFPSFFFFCSKIMLAGYLCMVILCFFHYVAQTTHLLPLSVCPTSSCIVSFIVLQLSSWPLRYKSSYPQTLGISETYSPTHKGVDINYQWGLRLFAICKIVLYPPP